MFNTHLSVPLATLTAVATITLMLACTPSQHTEQAGSSGPPVLLETKNELTENEQDARLRVETVKKSTAREMVHNKSASRAAAAVSLNEDAAIPSVTAYGSATSLLQP